VVRRGKKKLIMSCEVIQFNKLNMATILNMSFGCIHKTIHTFFIRNLGLKWVLSSLWKIPFFWVLSSLAVPCARAKLAYFRTKTLYFLKNYVLVPYAYGAWVLGSLTVEKFEYWFLMRDSFNLEWFLKNWLKTVAISQIWLKLSQF